MPVGKFLPQNPGGPPKPPKAQNTQKERHSPADTPVFHSIDIGGGNVFVNPGPRIRESHATEAP
jgi:hypothetical protein